MGLERVLCCYCLLENPGKIPRGAWGHGLPINTTGLVTRDEDNLGLIVAQPVDTCVRPQADTAKLGEFWRIWCRSMDHVNYHAPDMAAMNQSRDALVFLYIVIRRSPDRNRHFSLAPR